VASSCTVTASTKDDPHTLLSQRDKTLAALIARHGPAPRRRAVRASDRFASLAEIGRAAATIHGRFVAVLGNQVTPERVLAAPPETLASAGLSGAKAASIRDLADKVVAGQVSLERIGRLSDDAVVEHLTQVRGIGPWTADMFLLGTLGRLDVWPTGDYGVRAGFAAAWELAEVPTAAELMVLGEPFRPYRSLVAWYCWRVVDDRSAVG
jgi:DNA-3-methyladenine glycosylase II